MKNKLCLKSLFIAVGVLMAMNSCVKSEVNDLEDRVEQIEKTSIAPIQEQVQAIKSSIPAIEQTQAALSSHVENVKKEVASMSQDFVTKNQAITSAVEVLEKKSENLDAKIEELKAHCDESISGQKSWAEATFATIEQHNAVMSELATVKGTSEALADKVASVDAALSAKIAETDSTLMAKISDTEASMKAWVNEQLQGYVTIASLEEQVAKLKAEMNEELETEVDSLKKGVADVEKQVATLEAAIDSAKVEITEAYQAAITAAIEENHGVITKEIAAAVKEATDALKADIAKVEQRFEALNDRFKDLKDRVDEIAGRIRSIVAVPTYSDGSLFVATSGYTTLKFKVTPVSAAKKAVEGGKDNFKIDYVETESRANSIDVVSVAFVNDYVEVTVAGENLAAGFGSDKLSASLTISDGTSSISSQYFNIVVGIPVQVTDVEITLPTGVQDGDSFNVGETLQLSANLEGENDKTPTDRSVKWKSNNEALATVDQNGNVTFKQKGTVKISCTSNSDQAVVDEVEFVILQPVTAITVPADFKPVAFVGLANVLIPVSVEPTGADSPSDPTIDWTVSNNNISIVTNPNGGYEIEAVAPGTATVTGTAHDGSGKTVTFNVTVKQPVTDIAITGIPDNNTLLKGKTYPFSAEVNDDATESGVEWYSSNTDVVTVDKKTGEVTAVGKGTAEITAKATDGSEFVSDPVTLTVIIPVSEIVFSYYGEYPEDGVMKIGDYFEFFADADDAADIGTLSVTSSDPEVVSVANVPFTGNATMYGVRANAQGTATITIAATDGSGVSKTIELTVKATGNISADTNIGEGNENVWED